MTSALDAKKPRRMGTPRLFRRLSEAAANAHANGDLYSDDEAQQT